MLVAHRQTQSGAQPEVPAARWAAASERGEDMEPEPRYEIAVVVLTQGTRSAELDRARLRSVRDTLPSLRNRQADAYRWPAPA